ncbi:MAG: hypothetical protein KGL50_10240, partial [Burkholderiales bacterium]|nr:hypothetical protein [Burkholderiales bacterium]
AGGWRALTLPTLPPRWRARAGAACAALLAAALLLAFVQAVQLSLRQGQAWRAAVETARHRVGPPAGSTGPAGAPAAAPH